jgi:hypothetical protein
MQRLVISLLTILFAGCASGPLSKNSNLDSAGKQEGTLITCNGYKTWQDCDRAAANTCPGGYSVLSKEENLPMQGRFLRINCK